MQSRPGEKRLSSSLYFPNSSQETETERHGEKEAEVCAFGLSFLSDIDI